MRGGTLAALLLTTAAGGAALAQSEFQGVHMGKSIEVFLDQDQPFVNVGYAQGLHVGQVLPVAGGPAIGHTTEHRDVGSATVVEVWENLARLQLDATAAAAKGKKFIRVGGPDVKAARAEALAASGAAGVAPLESASPPLAPGTGTFAGPALPVHASLNLQRLYVRNDGSTPLHRCELRLPDNRHYVVPVLDPKDEEAIMLFRFSQDGIPVDRPLDSLAVKCLEGEASLKL